MIRVRAKVGTMATSIIHIGYRTKLPKVGDRIKFKEEEFGGQPAYSKKLMRSKKWQTGVVTKTMDLNSYPYYFIDRM